MKIRIKNNSIRLRLTQSEVEDIRINKRVTAGTVFPGGHRFVYTVETSTTGTCPEATFSDNEIRVSLPMGDVLSWATSGEVSLAGEQKLDDGELLKILVEKDFACLAPRPGEDETDMYPHPNVELETC